MWRKFNFFEKAVVDDEKASTFLKQNIDFTCSTSGKGNIILGDNKGNVHILDRSMNVTTFKAFAQRVNHIKHSKPNFVITVGDDESHQDVIKIYNLDKREYKISAADVADFQLVKAINLFTTLKMLPTPVTCMDINTEFSCAAMGLGTGQIILYYGELARGKGQIKLIQGINNGKLITGLGFRKYGPPASGAYVMFCTTMDEVFRYSLTLKAGTCTVQEPPFKLDEKIEDKPAGCDPGCCTMSNEGDMVVGNKTGVAFYMPEGKGALFMASIFEGKKAMLHWYRMYLIIVSLDFNKNANMQQVVTIYDLKNKYIAYRMASEKLQVLMMINEWGSLFLIGKERDGQNTQMVLYQFEEKDTQTKLELLLQKNLYTIALSLVNSQSLDYSNMIEIFRKYGDHLYSKKEYESAIKQYIKTIGRLAPSYVIQRYLDAQRISNLVTYLEELHTRKMATSDHTTLLLNCYTKLKDNKKEKLDNFIKSSSQEYDVETAISVCRQAGYREHALLLAEKHSEHKWMVKMYIEDFNDVTNLSNYRKALRYIESLEQNLAFNFLHEHAAILLSKLAKQTTNVLVRLCTDFVSLPVKETNRQLHTNIRSAKFKLNKTASPEESKQGSGLGELFGIGKRNTDDKTATTFTSDSASKKMADSFIGAYNSQPFWLIVFLEQIIFRNAKSEVSQTVYNTLIELYLQAIKNDLADNYHDDMKKLYEKTIPTTTTTTQPNTAQDQQDNYDLASVDDMMVSLNFKNRILQILDMPEANYDSEHILVLVQSMNFKDGILKMYAKLGLHYDIIRYYEEIQDYNNVIDAAIQYGEQDPNLWSQVLSFFANGEEPFEEEIQRVLKKIEKDNLLPPLQVIQILGDKRKTTLETIREYLSTQFSQDQRLIQEDMDRIKNYQQETQKMRSEIKTLQTSAKIFQLTTCSSCNAQLDLPAIHFMCGHSYHQKRNCLSGDECQICAKQNREILMHKKRFAESAEQHEQFFKQLQKKGSDGFSVVAEYFGRGIFKRVTAEENEIMTSDFTDDMNDEDDTPAMDDDADQQPKPVTFTDEEKEQAVKLSSSLSSSYK